MKKFNLEELAVVTGGTLVVAESKKRLTDEHEDWINEAGFEDWKRSEKETVVSVDLWPEHENVFLQFFANDRGDLTWIIKMFGKEGDIFGRRPSTVSNENAVRDLSRLRLEVEKLDIMLMRVRKLYK